MSSRLRLNPSPFVTRRHVIECDEEHPEDLLQTEQSAALAIDVLLHQAVKGLVAHALVPWLGMYAIHDKK